MSAQGDAALMLAAELAWAVFPLHSIVDGHCSCDESVACGSPGKHPRTLNGCLDASASPEQVGEWWDRWPNANIGLATGGWSDLVVIDVDGEEGEESLTQLLIFLGIELPPTVVSLTGRGRHLVYRRNGLPIGCSQDILGDSLDVRGEGGYIVAPDSVHYSGTRYRWENAGDLSAAVIPSEIIEEHARRQAERDTARERNAAARDLPRRWGRTFANTDRQVWQRVGRYAAKVPGGLSDGRKRTAFVYAAALIHDFRLPEGEAFDLLAAWNRGNSPALGERILARTFRNAVTYGGRRGRAA